MTTSTEATTLELVRTLPASTERVFAAWTRPEKMRVWFAPGPMRVPVALCDLRVGGTYRIEMHAPDGNKYIAVGTYKEIVANERLVFTWSWEGDPSPETLVTVTLRDLGGKTELKLAHDRFTSEEQRAQHLEGWTGCLDNLGASLGQVAVNCADLGCCEDVVSAPDAAKLMDALFDHAGAAHPDMAKAMTPEQAGQIKARIPEVTFTI
ncbi:MAG: SRPBCC domain-containing protein [Candidatus Sericytochromatia bacterium]|nr:SRPBCC domain-containing protein [Candidatus Tanganyikabacteria bacterium]